MENLDAYLGEARHDSSGSFTASLRSSVEKVGQLLEAEPALCLIRWIQGAIAAGAMNVDVKFRRGRVEASARVEGNSSGLNRALKHWEMAWLLAVYGPVRRAQVSYLDRVRVAQRTADESLEFKETHRPRDEMCHLIQDFQPRWLGLRYAYEVCAIQQSLRSIFAFWPGVLRLDALRIPSADMAALKMRGHAELCHVVEELELANESHGSFRMRFPDKKWTHNWRVGNELMPSCLNAHPKGMCRSLWASLQAPDLCSGESGKVGSLQTLERLEALPEECPREYDAEEDKHWRAPYRAHSRDVPVQLQAPYPVEAGERGCWLLRAYRAVYSRDFYDRAKAFFVKDGALLQPIGLPIEGLWSFWLVVRDDEVPVDASGRKVVVDAGVDQKLALEVETVNRLALGVRAWEARREEDRRGLWKRLEQTNRREGMVTYIYEAVEQASVERLLPTHPLRFSSAGSGLCDLKPARP
ncbi:MAG: hypothetical protein U0931_21570 [Vulcanimicrobiota bacterium]